MIQLIVAVGNPGLEYEETRHNIGWKVLDHLSFANDLKWKDKYKGIISDKIVKDHKFYFLKPMTFMNLSGESVQPMAHFFKIKPEEILVIHDEIDLPYGQVMFKKGGGVAGHNGLKSISQMLGTQNFLRFRIGVSRPIHGSVSSWVLGKFSEEERIHLDMFLEKSAAAIESSMKIGFEKTANKYSKKFLIPMENK